MFLFRKNGSKIPLHFHRLYPVDRKRVNEFGATGEEVTPESESKKDK